MILALSLIAGLALPASAEALVPTAAAAITLTDARGKLVQLAAPPQRIVSLLPSLAESVCALGACERIVGVDRYTTWPPALAQLPRLGGNLDPNIEAVLALRPDVVLISVASRAVQRFEALGLKVLALEPRTHAEVHGVLRTLATMLALPPQQGADPLWARIEQGLEQAARAMPAQARGQRVFFDASRGPVAAGAHSFIGETLARLGLVNVVPAALGPFPRLNPEYVVRADPDLLMGGQRSLGDSGVPYPGWSALRAVQAGRICRFEGAESDLMIRPGPRLAEAAMAMAACVRKVYP
ncbi:ABC transporter substrate-binding protein [Pantoea sp. 18069]|uniref:ABC transporter substrate-binding protein n=1 Tax=Pantoea sp. 18069 TaxID=2681415 RepID=UPI00190FABC9|nr:helical backbone metal receptor [Pantoea sp. 18069]